jgi:hypothetical protein
MNKYFLQILILNCIFSTLSYAQSPISLPMFFDQGYPDITAKGLGSAGTLVSNCNDASAVFYNPGALGFNTKINAMASGSLLFRNSNLVPDEYVSYTSSYETYETTNTRSLLFNSLSVSAPIINGLTAGFSIHSNSNPVRFSEEHDFEYEIYNGSSGIYSPSANQGNYLINASIGSTAKTFALGYAYNDMLGVGFSYGKVKSTYDVSQTFDLDSEPSRDESYFSSSSYSQFTFGFNYRSADWFGFGLKYTLPSVEKVDELKVKVDGVSLPNDGNFLPTLRPYTLDAGLRFGDTEIGCLLLNFSSVAIAPQVVINDRGNFITVSPYGTVDTADGSSLAMNYTQKRLGIAFNSPFFRVGYNLKTYINTNTQLAREASDYSPSRSIFAHAASIGFSVELDDDGAFVLDLGLEANFFNFKYAYKFVDQVQSYDNATNTYVTENEQFFLNYKGVQLTVMATLSWAIDAGYAK